MIAAEARPRLTELAPEDLAALLALTAAVDWDFTAGDFETAFASGRLCGHKDDSGRLLSAAGIFGYGETLAWVGAVMVHPAMQRRGLGSEAMRWCHEVLSEPQAVVALVATDEGEQLYNRLGYGTVERVHKAFAEGPLDSAPWPLPGGFAIEPLAADDMELCLEPDRRALGGERAAFLRARLAQSEAGLVLRDSGGRPRGFVLGVPRAGYLVVGPVVAPDAAAAAALIAALGAGHRGTLRIDVPTRHAALAERLPALGFREAGRPPVMTLEGRPLPGGLPGYYALSSQAFG